MTKCKLLNIHPPPHGADTHNDVCRRHYQGRPGLRHRQDSGKIVARNSPAGNYHDAKAMIPIQYKIIQRFLQRDPTVDHQDPDTAEKLRKALFTSVNSKTSQIDVTGPIPIIQDITAPDTFIELSWSSSLN